MEHDRVGGTARLDRPENDGLPIHDAFVTFAQNYEDVRLWRIFKDVPAGSYIDIGAQEPTLDSVSRAFYDRGWRGINVEPNSHYADLLRADRKDEQVIEAAVSSRKGKIRFHASIDNGLSTGRDDIAAGHAEAGFALQEVEVPTITLDEVFERLKAPCQWLKIDVEGMEKEVIESWKRAEYRPVVVIVEATLPNSQIQTYEDWEPTLLKKGYKFVLFDGLNRWYLRADKMVLAEALATPINIFDKFQVTAAHVSVGSILSDENKRLAIIEESARSSAEYAISLRAALDSLEKQYSETASNLDGANTQYAALHAELEAALARADDHEQAVARLNELQASNEDLRGRWADKLRLSLARTTAARTESAALRRELEESNGELARLKQAERDAAAAGELHRGQIQDLESARREAELAHEAMAAKAARLAEQLEKSNQEEAALVAQLAASKSHATETARLVDEAERNLISSNSQLEAAEARGADLLRQMEQGRQRLDQADARARTLQEDLASITAQLAATQAEARVNRAQAEAAAQKAEQDHSQAVAACRTEIEALRASLEVANQKLEQADQRARNDARRLAETEMDRNAARQTGDALKRENVQLAKQMTKQNADLDRAELRIDRLTLQLSALQQDLREQAVKLASKSVELGDALTREAALLADVDRLGRRIVQMRAESSATMASLLRAETQLEVLKSSYGDLETVRDTQDKLIANLESEIGGLREDVQLGDAEVARLDKAIDRLADDLRRAAARSRAVDTASATKRATDGSSPIWPIRLMGKPKIDRQ